MPACGHNSSPMPGGAQVPAPGQAATCVSLAQAEAQSVAFHRAGDRVGLARRRWSRPAEPRGEVSAHRSARQVGVQTPVSLPR